MSLLACLVKHKLVETAAKQVHFAGMPGPDGARSHLARTKKIYAHFHSAVALW